MYVTQFCTVQLNLINFSLKAENNKMNSIAPFIASVSKQLIYPVAPQITKSVGSMQTRALSGSLLCQSATLLQDHEGFGFARSNPRPRKPRSIGVTEIRGPYYSVRTTILDA